MISIPLVHQNHFAAFRPHTAISERRAILGSRNDNMSFSLTLFLISVFFNLFTKFLELDQKWTYDRKVFFSSINLLHQIVCAPFWSHTIIANIDRLPMAPLQNRRGKYSYLLSELLIACIYFLIDVLTLVLFDIALG